MVSRPALAAAVLAASAAAQQAGTTQPMKHPKLKWQKCTGPGSCAGVDGEVVIDANWLWTKAVSGSDNCYKGNKWTSACSTADDCATKCSLEGADFEKTYGAKTDGDALSLKFMQKHEHGTNIGSRFYLMASEDKYQMFTLLGNEFAFDVDLSTVDCGLNAALYFVAMDEDGGMARFPTNKAGAKYGTGYCDAQSARDLKFVGGKANIEGWKSSANDSNSGIGPFGASCHEVDIWESNSRSYAYTLHACTKDGFHMCQDKDCGGTYSEDRFAGTCDPNGCDMNPFRLGNTDFYGKGKTVDTSKKITVVTRFEKNKVSQFYVQDGKTIEIPQSKVDGIPATNALTAEYCKAQPKAFGDRDRFNEVGGFDRINDALATPLVLVMSLWHDHYAQMAWLDEIYPPDKKGQPGAARGDCPAGSGDTKKVEASQADAKVIWSNIRFGPIGSTVGAAAGSGSGSSSAAAPADTKADTKAGPASNGPSNSSKKSSPPAKKEGGPAEKKPAAAPRPSKEVRRSST